MEMDFKWYPRTTFEGPDVQNDIPLAVVYGPESPWSPTAIRAITKHDASWLLGGLVTTRDLLPPGLFCP
ncbi:uncharacterized protein PHALS_14307 [Plasmopara halstedii]|uniref:Uncharacterized protein n=1 Tax=Plasmopara halstedii TaxID=4781 RepID=A0A0P1ARM9_PLAHL|nr:uncharacterized protein PHALS_14307 [Plasmopara halstedii]CEG44037.1 hypothetical protein PHALS_14307 [Plasmopara halstedii]|eukprot:XP_024580406.1 hypothetical protein PHALS_14307 [Plasmopara halstedii]